MPIRERGSGGEPVVFIHIGPHKTGSSLLQHMLTEFKDELHEEGLCWPSKLKEFAFFAKAVHNGGDVSKYMVPIHHCLHEKKNVIISAEDLDLLDIPGIHRLAALFPRHRIMILAVYRDWVSRVYSSYTQSSKRLITDLHTFGHFLELYEQFNKWRFGLDLVGVLDKFQAVFGRESLILVDYNGVDAANGTDLAKVLFCDAMGVLCNTSLSLAGHVNVKPGMRPFELVYLLRLVAAEKGCTVGDRSSNKFVSDSMQAQYSGKAHSLPLITPSLSHLIERSKLIDQDFHNKYGDITLFRNPAANRAVQEAFTMDEVDIPAVFSNSSWTKWLAVEADKLIETKVFNNCTNHAQQMDQAADHRNKHTHRHHHVHGPPHSSLV